MPTQKKRNDFFESQEGVETRETLVSMMRDARYQTESTYNANAALYPKHLISFEQKHMEYLRNHPATDPQQYISNLRLITRIR